jgi:hypothetical protein
MSWTFACQDFSNHRFGDPRPPVIRKYFATEAAADAALVAYRTTHSDPDVYVESVVRTRQRRAPVVTSQNDFGFATAVGPHGERATTTE